MVASPRPPGRPRPSQSRVRPSRSRAAVVSSIHVRASDHSMPLRSAASSRAEIRRPQRAIAATMLEKYSTLATSGGSGLSGWWRSALANRLVISRSSSGGDGWANKSPKLRSSSPCDAHNPGSRAATVGSNPPSSTWTATRHLVLVNRPQVLFPPEGARAAGPNKSATRLSSPGRPPGAAAAAGAHVIRRVRCGIHVTSCRCGDGPAGPSYRLPDVLPPPAHSSLFAGRPSGVRRRGPGRPGRHNRVYRPGIGALVSRQSKADGPPAPSRLSPKEGARSCAARPGLARNVCLTPRRGRKRRTSRAFPARLRLRRPRIVR